MGMHVYILVYPHLALRMAQISQCIIVSHINIFVFWSLSSTCNKFAKILCVCAWHCPFIGLSSLKPEETGFFNSPSLLCVRFVPSLGQNSGQEQIEGIDLRWLTVWGNRTLWQGRNGSGHDPRSVWLGLCASQQHTQEAEIFFRK